MSRNIFIAGTGTDVGKTFVSGLIVKKLAESGCNVGYFKAAVSGNERAADGSLVPGDAVHVKTTSGISQLVEQMCPYVYQMAVSPHLAAKIEGNPVDMSVIHGYDHPEINQTIPKNPVNLQKINKSSPVAP